ncbi:MAG: YjbH domain-containing protein, partial [Pseudomonadales bacterium]
WSVDEPPERWDASEDFRPDSWYARLLFDVERSGLLMLSGDLRDQGRSAWLELENGTYQYEADAIRRVLSLAELHLPRSVRTVHVILQNDGIAQSHIRYQRRLGGATAGAFALADEASLISVMPPRAMVAAPDYATAYRKPLFNFGVNIGQRMMIMDPDDPLRYQVLARINLGADLGWDWYLRSSVALDLYNDWDTIERTSDSVLPRVRSEIRQYLQQGNTGIDSLYLEKRGMVTSDLVYRAYGGILEEMFAGVGGEMLYRPFPSRLAFGLNLNYVWQRDFDKRFSVQDYKVLQTNNDVAFGHGIRSYAKNGMVKEWSQALVDTMLDADDPRVFV